jgi:hypothetical protein
MGHDEGHDTRDMTHEGHDDDLTRADDERNVDSFTRGDQSPHPTFGLRPAWSALRARRSKSTSMKHPITGTVEEGRSRHDPPETA